MSRPLSNKSVLVVEDELLLCLELTRILKRAGCTVVGPVPTLEAAESRIDVEGPIDLAILDINLGGTLVFPLARRLQREKVPFVFATGYEPDCIPGEFDSALQIRKPYSEQDCLNALQQALQKAKASNVILLSL